MSKSDIEIKVNARNNASRALNEAAKDLHDLGRSADDVKISLSGMDSIWSNLSSSIAVGATKFMAAIAALKALSSAAEKAKEAFFDYNALLEQNSIAFETMTGSADNAKKHMQELKAFAEATPFDTVNLMEMSKAMHAYGFETDQVLPILRTFGNAAAAAGRDATSLKGALIQLAQAKAKGKFTAADIRPMIENGIPVYDVLQKKLGLSPDDVANADFNTVITALMEGLDERFGGMLDRQAQTATGKINNIKESLANSLGQLGQPLFDWCNDQLNYVQDFANNFRHLVTGELSLGDILAESFGEEKAASIVDFCDNMADSLSRFFNSFVDMQKHFANISENLSMFIPFEKLAAAVEIACDVLATFMEIAEMTAEVIDNAFTAAVTRITEVITEVWNYVVENTRWLYDQITGVFNTAGITWPSIFGDTLNNILKQAAEWVSKMIPIFQPIINLINRVSKVLGGEHQLVSGTGIKETEEIGKTDWGKLFSSSVNTGYDGGSTSSKAAAKEEKAAERMADKIQKSWDRLMDKISDACDTTYEKGMKRLQKEIEEYRKQVSEAAAYGLDTTALEAALEDYAYTMKRKLSDAWTDAYNAANLSIRKIKANLTGNVQAKIEVNMDEALEKMRKEYRDLEKSIIKGPEDKKSREVLADWKRARELEAYIDGLKTKQNSLYDNLKNNLHAMEAEYEVGNMNYDLYAGLKSKDLQIYVDNLNKLLCQAETYSTNKLGQADVLQKALDGGKIPDNEIAQTEKEIENLRVEYQAASDEAFKLYANMNEVKAQINKLGIGKTLEQNFVYGLHNAQEKFKTFGNSVQEMASDIADNIHDCFRDLFTDLVDGQLKSFKEYFSSFCKSITHAIAELYAKMAAKSLINWFSNSLFGGKATGGYVPGYASGTGNASSTFIVGENGPELMHLNSGSAQITSTHTTRRKLSEDNTPNVTVNVINQSGQKMDASKGNMRFDGESYVIDVILRALQNNTGGMRTAIASA